MMRLVPSRCLAAAFASLLVACAAPQPAAGAAPAGCGMLLAIGGGLDDDNAQVFERFLELARGARGTPRVVVMTAATGDQDVMAAGKVAALQTWSWEPLRCIVVKRETPTADTVAAIDAATALFFTGGDQKRIVDRYRPGDAETPEWQAMQRLLLRGGVIAGSSAGLAMMGDTMLLGGTSAEALGVGENGGGDAPAGPRIGAGMHFLPHVITDTHFFERNRVGRLVAALEAAGERFGIAVGEDGAVEIDIGLQTATGVAVSESLLVDTGAMTRDGDARRGIVAVRIPRGRTVSLQQLRESPPSPAKRPPGEPMMEAVVEEGQNRQLASWRLFARASRSGPWQLVLDGFCVTAWPADGGTITFDVEPLPDGPTSMVPSSQSARPTRRTT